MEDSMTVGEYMRQAEAWLRERGIEPPLAGLMASAMCDQSEDGTECGVAFDVALFAREAPDAD